MKDFVTLPDAHAVRFKRDLTALEEFVLLYEPETWPAVKQWREALQRVLEEVAAERGE